MTGQVRIAVVGAGGVGTVLAAAAGAAGHRVTVCARRPLGPLVLERSGDRIEVAAEFATDPSTVEQADWVLLATKAYDVAGTGAWLARLVGPATRVVVCQNGIDHALRLAGLVPADRVVPAVVGIVAQRHESGVVVHRQGHALTVADDAAGAALAELFARTPADRTSSRATGGGLDIMRTKDFDRTVWLKFLGNLAAAPVTTLIMRPLGRLRCADLRPLLRDLLTEAVAVGRADGVDLSESDVDTTLALLDGLDPEAQSSMQTDRAAGRPLETDAITGALVALADRRGVDVPWNRTMLALLHHLGGTGGR